MSREERCAAEGAAQEQTPATGQGRLEIFLRSSAVDFALVLVVAVSLVMTVSFGFESAPELRGNPLVAAALCAPLLLALFGGSWSKRAVVPSAVLAVLVAAVELAVLGALGSEPLFVDGVLCDSPGCYLVFGFVAAAVPVLVFLLSRRRVGVLALLVASALSCAFVQFMYRDWVSDEPGTAVFLVCMVAAGALMVFQSYREGLYGSVKAGQARFALAGLFACGLSSVCVLAGAALFVGIVSQLGLGTPSIRPFQDYYKRPVIEYTGVFSQQPAQDPSITTNQVSDEESDANRQGPGGIQSDAPDQIEDANASPIDQLVQAVSSFDMSSWLEGFSAVSYQQLLLDNLPWIALAILAVLALVLLWRRQRQARLARMAEKPAEWRVWFLYHWLLERFHRLGISKPDNSTPLEFAMATRAQLEPFARGTGGVDFLAVTLAYQRACFGSADEPDEDCRLVEAYYRAFFKNARDYVGGAKWLLKFWRM
ncbi:MAG: hypothetical protein ACI36V_01400 [Coriobacteriales bacterium]